MTTAAAPSLQDEIASLGPWFHNLHLPDGTQTRPDSPLGDFPRVMWNVLGRELPEDLSGWSVLDIGCNTGFYSFELARRGARVLGIDIDEHYLKQARWAVGKFGLEDRVTFERMGVYDLARVPGKWDLVLFLGVLYHLRHPLLALDIVSKKVGRMLAFQTMSMPGDQVLQVPENPPLDGRRILLDDGWPKMAFIEHRLADDPTNWWAPNHACIEAMLRSAGLTVRSHPGVELYLCTPEDTRKPVMRELADLELAAATGCHVESTMNGESQ